MPSRGFSKNVFINCPFDEEYLDLLRPLLFTILFLGYQPRISKESSDSGEPRINKIVQLIEESRFGIHDLSRLKSKKKGELSRFNMPFELGLDYGCKYFKCKKKKCLILETEKYRFQAAISDLSNSDIKAHEDKPDKVVRHVRDWLVQEDLGTGPSPTNIWYSFQDFMGDNYVRRKEKGFSEEDIKYLTPRELFNDMKKWIQKHKE